MSKAKKVIFVIVEGPTDKDALSSVLKQIFSSAEVHFHVIYPERCASHCRVLYLRQRVWRKDRLHQYAAASVSGSI